MGEEGATVQGQRERRVRRRRWYHMGLQLAGAARTEAPDLRRCPATPTPPSLARHAQPTDTLAVPHLTEVPFLPAAPRHAETAPTSIRKVRQLVRDPLILRDILWPSHPPRASRFTARLPPCSLHRALSDLQRLSLRLLCKRTHAETLHLG